MRCQNIVKTRLYYFVDNVSDMYPVPLSTSAALKYAYNPAAYQPSADGNWTQTQLDFLREWSGRQYGTAVANEAADLYAAYFNISYIATGHSDEFLAAALGKLSGAGSADIRTNGTVVNKTATLAETYLAEIQDAIGKTSALHAAATVSHKPRVHRFFYCFCE